MPYYECVYLARQDIAASQVDALSDGFAETIAEGGGEVKKREYWGLRNLAYRVKKNRKAHYVLMNIDAPASAVHEMQRLMRLNADVLRELTLRVDELNEGPSIMMQRREERRDRGERRSRRDEERRAERAAAAEKEAAGKAPAEDAPAKKPAEEKPAEEAPAEEAPVEEAAEKTAESKGGDA
ncbi:MAG: 30S ribosomal protein S6 [Rhodospirillaceae bacterium]|nr:30S ribosomal protein S6 [Rhodospirillaceae bacterium]